MPRAALVALALSLSGVATMAAEPEARRDSLGDPLPDGAVQRLGTLRMRYNGVGGLAYLPDGRGVVLSGGRVDLWDLQRGVRQSSTNVSAAGLVSVQARADGQVLLLGDGGGRVCEWSPVTQAELRGWQTGQKALRSAVWSPDGQRLLVAGNLPPGLEERDLATGRVLVAVRSQMVHIQAGAIYGPDGRTAILGGGYTHNLEHYDLASGRLLHQWCTVYEAKHLALSPDGTCLTVGLEDRAVEWALGNYSKRHDYKHCPGEAARIFAVAYLPGTDDVLCGGRDGTIHRWSRATGQRVGGWRPHQSQVAPLVVSPDGQWVLSYGTGLVAETNVATGQPRLSWARHVGSVEAVAFMPSGTQVLSGSTDETLRLWDVATGRTVRVFTGASLGVYAVAVAPDGQRFAAGCKDGAVREYGLAAAGPERVYTGHLGFVRQVAYTPDGSQLLSSADDGSIRIWQRGQMAPVAILQGHRGGVLALAVSPDGRRVLSGGRDTTVRVWDRAAGTLLQTLTGTRGWVNAVAFTPDGAGAVSVGRDGLVRRWDLTSGQTAQAFGGGQGEYAVVRCTPDGRRVVVTGSGQRVMCYDLASGELRASHAGHQGAARSLAIAPDGLTAVSGSADTSLLVWRLP